MAKGRLQQFAHRMLHSGGDHVVVAAPAHRAPDQLLVRVGAVHVRGVEEVAAELARAVDKPLIVHVRDAWADALRVLGEGSAERVVIHCFTGDEDVARECARRGYWISFAGNVTYPKNAHMREAASVVDLDRILVETDSPFLAPQKLRGSDNAPQNVLLTLAALAEIRDEPIDLLVEATASNARNAFPGLRDGV